MQEVRPGLWRWTAQHPDWEQNPTPESPADWPREVGSVAYASVGAFVLVDPLVPAGRPDLWERLDELVEGHGKRVAVFTTVRFHRRSRDEVVARYDASTSRAKRSLPDDVEPIPIRGAGETMCWLPKPRALVPGDRLLGDCSGGLRLCPESWLGYLPSGMSLDGLRKALRPLLELPVELVLASHGDPVLRNGRAAVAAAVSG